MSPADDIDLSQPEQTLVVRPGQTLVLRYAVPVSEWQVEEIRRRVATRIPGVEVLVICGPCEQMLVYQPGDLASTAPTGAST